MHTCCLCQLQLLYASLQQIVGPLVHRREFAVAKDTPHDFCSVMCVHVIDINLLLYVVLQVILVS